jgi:hypothetical protein
MVVNMKVNGYRGEMAMYQPKRFAGVVLVTVILASLFLGDSAFAQEAKSVELHLTPLRESGVIGTATLSNVEDGVQVKLDMQSLPEAGVKHINHFHGGGTCADVKAGRMAPVTIPLKTIVAKEDGTGSATTTIKDATLDKLLGKDQHRFILVHAKVKCADLPQGSANTTFKPLPASGGLPPVVLLVVPLTLLLVGVSAVMVLRRCIA